MSDKFRGKYRNGSVRLKDYDYSSDGGYFITICTKNRTPYFGEIKNGIMGLNELGCIAAKFWQEIPRHFENVILDAWVVMPDHLHGILILENGPFYDRGVAMQHPYHKKKPEIFSPEYFSFISPKSKSIPAIIRSFKSIVSRTIHEDFPEENFEWQALYHDHVIRNEAELNRIHHYIINNPPHWAQK